MVQALKQAFPDAQITMIPGGRGDFLVVANGATLWDKRKCGEFPTHAEILSQLT